MIREATLFDLVYVTKNLRDRDRQELAATRDISDLDALAADAFSTPWRRVADDRDGRPCLCVGAKWLHEGVISMWGFGTPDYKDGVKELTKYILNCMVPELLQLGVRRAQCVVHPENRASQRWLKTLGFYPEATLSRFGAGDQDMVLYAWVADDRCREQR